MPTSLDTDLVKDLLRSFKFKELFTELGWDHLDVQSIKIAVGHANYELEAVAQKRGVQVFVCWAQSIPEATLRHKIDSRLTQHAHEHLLIFAETAKLRQVWQWVAHEAGQPHFPRSFSWHKGQDGNVLTQRLAEIAVPISEEESIDLTTMTHRLKDAFDRDKVTKRFYERFAKEREQFQTSIKGLAIDDAKWYTSVIVDRLMFIYFLQKQGFLAAGDRAYLHGKLDFIQFKGPDLYYGEFLHTLFFEGFAKPVSKRSPEVQRMLGDIPYLNGGLFAPHHLEEEYGNKIHIADSAFEKLLTFFDQYQWTLDDRPLGNDNEINPDVLGYIFEKYVNQKQMGAYYTKEDITGYISQETIIPRLFDMVRTAYRPAFSGACSVFMLLKDDPDAYIYPSMRKGARDSQDNKVSLPGNIAQGLHDVSKRGDWNRPASADYALPTEIWREVVARTQRYEEVRKHCVDGDITDINDLITYNLDIRQFAQDTIAQSDDPVFVLEFYKALTAITILDPTCGSGAFLFAALNILERLYEVCLQRMEQFQQDGNGYTGQALRAVQQFDTILKEADRHSNRRYFILKSIVVHNLYGVDIMEEAVEICKLRLFLRLVAELKPDQPVEPLPDIDFNIKAGNTLVGYTHLKDVKVSRAEEFFGKDRLPAIEQQAQDLARLYAKMQDQQMVRGGRVTPKDKRALEERRRQMADELDAYLAYDYGIQTQKSAELRVWRTSAQPFHWFAEFYDIIEKGGFDVVMGNPPYVEYPSKDIKYHLLNSAFCTIGCGNLYAFVVERSEQLVSAYGTLGMIVPVSLNSTDRMGPARQILTGSGRLHYVTFADRPSCLFNGVHQILTVFVFHKGCVPRFSSAGFLHWNRYERDQLFHCLCYVTLTPELQWMKVGSEVHKSILDKIAGRRNSLASYLQGGDYLVTYCSGTGGYWLRAFDEAQISTEYRMAFVSDMTTRTAVIGVLNSTTFYLFWRSSSDCRHLTQGDVGHFGIDLQDRSLVASVADAAAIHLKCLKATKETRYGKVTYEQYRPAATKTYIDAVDERLCDAYGFSKEELDYIINYDIKYRMGISGEDDGDDV